MDQDDLLSTLRSLEPEPEPSFEAQAMQHLVFLINVLEDLKLKQSITNELLYELVEQGKERNRSDSASQARPIRNVPAPRPIRRWSENKTY
jgi:hypothetical protein